MPCESLGQSLGTVAGRRIVVWLELPVRQREPSASRAYSVATEATGSDCCSETWVLQTKYRVHRTGPRNAQCALVIARVACYRTV